MNTGTLSQPSSRPIAVWILIGVGMLIVQIILGGITRLTGSGLSITEWNVVTGTLPPLNETKWLEEFAKYKQTPQFNLLNTDFTLREFKFIFFWEWFHRFWARLIGVVFLIPFLIFLKQKRFRQEMIRPLIVLFLLGALQGAIGWIMVASGLTGDAIYVKPAKLALHFIFAMVLVCYAFWFALELLIPAEKRLVNKSIRNSTLLIIGLLGLQLIYGALMAGHKAATFAPTWPDINGQIIPDYLWNPAHGLYNFIDNRVLIHFVHRGLAYILFVLVIFLSVRLFKEARRQSSSLLKKGAVYPGLFVIVQVVLGIFSVLTAIRIVPNRWGVFEWLAQFHQLIAMCLLLSLIWVLYVVRKR